MQRLENAPGQQTLLMSFCEASEGMPGKNLADRSSHAVLDHEEPSCVAKGIEPANGARQALCDRDYPIGVLWTSSQALTAALGQEAWTSRASLRGTVSIPCGGVKTEREVRRASVAEPEVFTPAELPPVAVENGWSGVRRQSVSARNSLPSRRERREPCRTDWRIYGAWLCPVFSSVELSAREIPPIVHARGPKDAC